LISCCSVRKRIVHMKKPVYNFSYGVLAFATLYVALWSAEKFLEWTFDFGAGNAQIDIISTSFSPNEEYKATMYRDMGGGAAGWCSIKVSLQKNTEQFERNKETAFSTRCNIDVNLVWNDNKNLLISYTNDSEGMSLYQTFLSNDKVVKITYSAE
jgi:hypothetical protein